MELRDLIVTPIIIFLVYVVAYLIRPRVTDNVNRKYFFPALTVRIIGALAVGFIYQFYYDGGDTYNFHTYGSRIIWEAIVDDPQKGFSILFGSGTGSGEYKYTSRIIFFNDPSSFTVIRLATIFDLVTFSSYSATAVIFGGLSFVGMWMLFIVFYKQQPRIHFWIAIACFFIPSVAFWGSGILKDTVVLAMLGVLTFYFYKIFFEREITATGVIILALAVIVIFSIKKFVLQAYLPVAFLWIVLGNIRKIKSFALQLMVVPFAGIVVVVSGYFAVLKIGEDDPRYDVSKLAITAQTTAYDIRFWTGRDAGSGYTLGELDGSFSSMFKLAPQAINVSLFRPYLWEAKNPLMLLSALESLFLLCFFLYIIIQQRKVLWQALRDPSIIFCLLFSLVFAFAVGVSTFNFGTLVRYKIIMLPFFLMGLILMLNYVKRDRKLSELDTTE